MDKKEYNDLLQTDVYKDVQGLFLKFYQRYLNPATNAVYLFRKMQYMNSFKDWFHKIITKLLQKKLANQYGILASPNAIIGKNLRFVHPSSIVIGAHVVAGENLSLYQNTTLGGSHTGDVNKGNQPVLGNNVTVFANSLILGKVLVGNNVVIGANSLVLLSDIPENAVCVGSPAKIINRKIK
ncbi:hypothetical protein B5E77_03875 [Lachnoclostridium sp. An131]|uniref:serine O-acetyltransferase n=1 Tax=Lachnoclostridium sp. An131 TaxID=1965555 RepID=UPI000B3AC4D8|nr:hypothetical protein [Lachnoclostridium sp. An131]OUQ27964.1 hypothetical protein B5E77_03875 [Lachnoclostridium sp. An131]